MASSPVAPREDEQVSSGIDDLHISLQAEQEDTQKKTFTCWINSQLVKHTSPSVITDLFTDIRKGHVLLDLLEVLSGQQLPRDKGSNTFQCRINIEHALTFLKSRSIKLINIHVADIVEGNPSIILGLIWTIILHFHIEELTQALSCNSNQPSVDETSVADPSPTSSPPAKKCSTAQARWQLSAKKALLLWAQERCATHESISVTDFKSSWRNGLAFLAVIHALRPDLIDLKSVKHKSNKDNLKEAFEIAERELKIPRLLEPEDVDVVNPDEKSIMTYVAQFLQYSKKAPVIQGQAQGKAEDATAWLALQEKKLQQVQKDAENESYFNKSQSLLSFMESFSEEKKPFLDILSLKGNAQEPSEDQRQLVERWDRLSHQINTWKAELDGALPAPLCDVSACLQEVEELGEELLPASQDSSDSETVAQEKMALYKNLVDRFDYQSNILLTFENEDEEHQPLVPPHKLEEMRGRLDNILEKNLVPLLEFQYHKCSILGLLEGAKSKLEVWNSKCGNKEAVGLLLEDWHKFIEEKEFLSQLDTSFRRCGEICKNLAGKCEAINDQYKIMEQNVCVYRKNIENVKSTLQKVLVCWATYTENLRSLRACFEDIKKEQLTEVPFETLSRWSAEHATLNDVGHFLIDVSNAEVGSSVAKELRRLNKRWRKFITKTPLEMKLPLTKKEDQPIPEDSGNILSSKEEQSTAEFSMNRSGIPESHDQSLKAREEHEREHEESPGKLKLADEVEKLAGQVETWEAETRSVLDHLGREDAGASSEEAALQHLSARGSMFEELLARTEDALQMDIQSISGPESLQHVLTVGLQAKIQEANEKIQITMVKLSTALKNSTETSPESDVKLKVDELQRELESYMKGAEQLLGQRDTPGDLISKYKEALRISNANSLGKYLKAVEELKLSFPEEAKLSLEEKSGAARAKWESLHQEISLYIQQLKIDIEKGKLRDKISKLEKQINKEKKLIRRGKSKGLIKEHEACFAKDGIMGQLDHHMGVLRVLSEELASQERQQEVKQALRDYEQRTERLLKSASEILRTLQAPTGVSPKVQGTVTTAENGGKDSHSEEPLAKPANQPSAEKAVEANEKFSQVSELKPHREESMMGKDGKDETATVNKLQESYDAHKALLELHLQKNESRVTCDFSNEKEWRSTCLQDKLKDLQLLKNEMDACWKEFEVMSAKLESLARDAEKPAIVKARATLKGRGSDLQMSLKARMESLELALQVVSPVEEQSLLLCGSDPALREVTIREFRLVDADGVHQNLRSLQDSIARQIAVCRDLEEPGNSVLRGSHPVDIRATQNILQACRTQLEQASHRVQMAGGVLAALEELLSSLAALKPSEELVTEQSASAPRETPGNTSTGRNTKREIEWMKAKAQQLDEHLQTLGITFVDAEQGRESTCEQLVDAASAKVPDTPAPGVPRELAEDHKLLEACSSKNNELFKNIQDVQKQMSEIGLKDPTVPAVKHRKKSLIRLEKDLDGYEAEKIHLEEMASSLPQFKDGREKIVNEQCQSTVLLWDSTKTAVTECLEQCGRVLELLKQYQNFKSVLTTLIQKEEMVISQQASYMGKENLKKRMAEIEIVKEEFSEHLEVVDKINQICKNLQFHLNKMKTFEEPPFEKEANVIVDRWLDINEKTEEYYENLGRALGLWDKLFNLKNFIDEWTEETLQKLGSHPLTEEDRERLKEELRMHEQQTSEFSRRVSEIQFLLQSNEKPLELQVMESSMWNKMEDVKQRVTGDANGRVLGGSQAELREDLDQAKTQIGMTESLLKALSPSDSLEILSKLEEIQQQILQQKHSMIILENQIGCLTPELSDLKKQYESVSDLFNTKKSALQDHFSALLNDQCKNFDDWFSNVEMNLKDCFEPSETKKGVQQKLQKLSDFLSLEGRSGKIQQVETVLQHVRKHLPKARVKELGSWLQRQELQLEKVESAGRARAEQLEHHLQQLRRLEDECRNLSEWLISQEKRWKETEDSGEKAELFCQALARKREQFQSVAHLSNFLKEHGLTEEEEIIMESTHLMDRYQVLLTQLGGIEEEPKLVSAQGQSFPDLARDVIHWIKEIKESLMALNSSEGKMPLEERIQKIKV